MRNSSRAEPPLPNAADPVADLAAVVRSGAMIVIAFAVGRRAPCNQSRCESHPTGSLHGNLQTPAKLKLAIAASLELPMKSAGKDVHRSSVSVIAGISNELIVERDFCRIC
jgi:hypothetical protein